MRTIYAIAAAGCVLAAASAASAQTTGWVAADYQGGELWDYDYEAVALSGSVTAQIAPQWSVQADAAAQRIDVYNEATTVAGTVHAVYAASDRLRIGAFAGADWNDTETSSSNDSGSAVGIGAEALFAVSPDVALYGGVAYAWIDPRFQFFPDTTAIGARAEVRWMATDNTRIDGFAQRGQIDFDGYRDFSKSSAGVGVEHAFSAISAYASYEHSWIEGYSTDYDADTFLVGVRWSFGGANLRARHGAEMATFNDVLSGSGANTFVNGPGVGFYD